MLKCNVDVSFSNNEMGICMYIRDHNGNFMRAKTTNLSAILLVKDNEAYNLLQAIKWVVSSILLLLYSNLMQRSWLITSILFV